MTSDHLFRSATSYSCSSTTTCPSAPLLNSSCQSSCIQSTSCWPSFAISSRSCVKRKGGLCGEDRMSGIHYSILPNSFLTTALDEAANDLLLASRFSLFAIKACFGVERVLCFLHHVSSIRRHLDWSDDIHIAEITVTCRHASILTIGAR